MQKILNRLIILIIVLTKIKSELLKKMQYMALKRKSPKKKYYF